MPTKLSVNVNKIATLRNSRGGNNPNLVEWVKDIEAFGADGITVHPRPDERHITYKDVSNLKKIITTEFNIEGNPKEEKFVQLVLETLPDQVTLVPDDPNQLTSNHGWNTIKELEYLKKTTALFKNQNIRVSIFLDPDPSLLKAAAETGTDRIELYTEDFAKGYISNRERSIKPYIDTAVAAKEFGLGLNAGHDLDLNNLSFFVENVPDLLEVSIGHALVSDALRFGMQNTVQMYRRCLHIYNY